MKKPQPLCNLNGIRTETGAVKIDDDWNGLFIRGDDCAILKSIFRTLILESNQGLEVPLDINDITFLDDLLNIIDNDVMEN